MALKPRDSQIRRMHKCNTVEVAHFNGYSIKYMCIKVYGFPHTKGTIQLNISHLFVTFLSLLFVMFGSHLFVSGSLLFIFDLFSFMSLATPHHTIPAVIYFAFISFPKDPTHKFVCFSRERL